jgi:hypothetical protein
MLSWVRRILFNFCHNLIFLGLHSFKPIVNYALDVVADEFLQDALTIGPDGLWLQLGRVPDLYRNELAAIIIIKLHKIDNKNEAYMLLNKAIEGSIDRWREVPTLSTANDSSEAVSTEHLN